MVEEYLSQRAFAKHIGLSAPRVNTLVKDGRIPTVFRDGKVLIPKNKGEKAYQENKVMGFERAGEAGKKFGGDPRKTKHTIPQSMNDDEDEDSKAPDDEDLGKRYNKAKTEEKEWMAKKRELEYLVEKKKFVSVEDIKHEAAQLAAKIRQKILATAPFIAASAEGKTVMQIQRIVEIELNEALKELQKLEV